MGPGDTQDQRKTPGNVAPELVEANAIDELDQLVAKLAAETFSSGEIERMQLPAGWGMAGSQGSGQESLYEYQAFSPAETSEVLIWFFYRGYFLSKSQGKRFREILDKPPHVLAPGEIKNVAQVIRDKSNQDDFELFSPRTESLNGKMVLVIEGRYVEAQEDAYSIYVDADGSGRLIRELHYRAPKYQFLRYLTSARKTFRSIVWKDSGQG